MNTQTMRTLESVLAERVAELEDEVRFLREIVRALADQNPGVIRHSVTGQEVRRDA